MMVNQPMCVSLLGDAEEKGGILLRIREVVEGWQLLLLGKMGRAVHVAGVGGAMDRCFHHGNRPPSSGLASTPLWHAPVL